MVSGGSAYGDTGESDHRPDGYVAHKYICIHWLRTNGRGPHGWVHVRNICEITIVIIALLTLMFPYTTHNHPAVV